MIHTVFIALGSNLGDRLANLQAAIDALKPDIRPCRCSSIYETPPWGYLHQPKFYNQVVSAETELEPAGVLGQLKSIEVQLGRQETFRYGPRVIDLDILFFDDLVIDSPPLIIPHPRMHERAFVLMPLAELAADLHHPLLGCTVNEMLSRVDVSGIVRVFPGNCHTQE